MPHPDFARAVELVTPEKIRDLTIALVDIPSPTGQEAGVANFLAAHMAGLGMETDLPQVDQGRPNAVGHLRGRGDGLNLLFTGHMDTSYSGEEPHLHGEGFRPKGVFRDGWIWGLGANNMKSGLACALVAIEAIVRSGIDLAGDISFGAVVGEIEKTAIEEFQGIEYSGYGVGTRHLATHGVTADFAVLAEPTGMRIATANMGVVWARITVQGVVAHSAMSNRAGTTNAIAVMHELQSDIAAWARAYEAGTVYMGERPNATVAAIRGGDPWRLSRNPYECSLYLDIRTVPGQIIDGIKRELRGVLRGFAARKSMPEPRLHIYVSDPPNLVDAKLPVVEALSAAQQLVTGQKLGHVIRRPGADAIHLTSYGIPCVPFGAGGRLHPDTQGSSMHAFGEHVLLEDCLNTAKIYLAVALDLCSRKP
jgi:acetylornithine deacetylase